MTSRPLAVRIIADGAVYGIVDFAFRALNFALFPLYAHLLGVADFGVLELLITTVSIIGIISGFGMINAVSRLYYESDAAFGSRSIYVSTGFAIQTAFGMLISLLAILIFFVFDDELTAAYRITPSLGILAVASLVPSQSVNFAMDMLRLQFNRLRFILLVSIRNIVTIIATIIFVAFLGWGVSGVLAGTLLGPLAAIPFAAIWLRNNFAAPNLEHGSHLLSFGHAFIYMGLAYWVLGSTDRWMLAVMSDLPNVGFYSIAFKIASIVTFVVSAFGQAWNPHAMQIYASHPAPGKIFGQALLVWTAIMAGVCLLLCLIARNVLMVLTPEAYWQASTATSLCIASAAALGTTQLTALGLTLAKRTQYFISLSWACAAINVLLNTLLIPVLGAAGAAFASLVSAVLLSLSYLFFSQRFYGFDFKLGKLGVFFCVIVLSPFLAILIEQVEDGPARWFLKIAVISMFSLLLFFSKLGVRPSYLFRAQI